MSNDTRVKAHLDLQKELADKLGGASLANFGIRLKAAKDLNTSLDLMDEMDQMNAKLRAIGEDNE